MTTRAFTLAMALPVLFTGRCVAQYLADNTGMRKEVQTIYQAGERAYRSGDHATAIERFTEVLRLDDDHLNAYLQRGFCHSLNKDYQAAVKDFTAVIARKQDHLWAFTSRGSAYLRMGEPQLALKDFDAVLALDARNEEAFNNRGWAHKALGDLDAACRDWKASQRLGNGEAKIILTNTRCK